MKVEVIYPHVIAASDSESRGPEFYQPYHKRFIASYHEFQSGCPHVLRPVFCVPNPVDFTDAIEMYRFELLESFAFEVYCGNGWDLGCHQSIASGLDCDIAVCLVTPTHFRENNWLLPIVEAFEKYGDGLYGTSASYQNTPHIRTGCFAFSPATMRQYPHVIDSREKSFYFESGQSPHKIEADWCFTNWMMAQDKPVKLVTREACYDMPDWRKPNNIFRRGDQSNALAWDRHFDIYNDAPSEERMILENLANGKGAMA